MDTSKLKPFDLEAALAGKPVANRREMEMFVTKFSVARGDGMVLLSQDKNGAVLAYPRADGTTGTDSEAYRLFMAPTERTLWVNLYGRFSGHSPDGHSATWYETETDADNGAGPYILLRLGGKAHSITVSE